MSFFAEIFKLDPLCHSEPKAKNLLIDKILQLRFRMTVTFMFKNATKQQHFYKKCCCCFLCSGLFLHSLYHREFYRYPCSLAQLTFHTDCAAVVFHNLLGYCKTETRAALFP